MYFRRCKKTIIKAIIFNGLYWVTYVESDGKKETAFSATDAKIGGLEEHTNQPHSTQHLSNQLCSAETYSIEEPKPYMVRSAKIPITDIAIKQYKLYHQRFSHLGPKKL